MLDVQRCGEAYCESNKCVKKIAVFMCAKRKIQRALHSLQLPLKLNVCVPVLVVVFVVVTVVVVVVIVVVIVVVVTGMTFGSVTINI